MTRKNRQQTQKRGRAGGLARKKGKKRTKKTVPCSVCRKEINVGNLSGMCITCFNESRAKTKKTGTGAICRHCGGPARRDSVTGYCYKCYRESLHWKSRQKDHANWVTTNVCGKDAKTRQPLRKKA